MPAEWCLVEKSLEPSKRVQDQQEYWKEYKEDENHYAENGVGEVCRSKVLEANIIVDSPGCTIVERIRERYLIDYCWSKKVKGNTEELDI